MAQTLTLPGLREGVKTADLDEKIPLFNVVLLDDDEHTYEYVIEMLTTLFLLTKGEAFQKAVEVDSFGRTIVITCERPQAEFGRDQIHAFGADSRMPNSKGSMSSVVEPAREGK